MSCSRANNFSRKQSRKCRESLWMRFRNKKFRRPIRQVSMTKSWPKSRRTWCGRIKTCHRLSRTLRSVIGNSLRKSALSRSTNGSSSTLFLCSVSSATSSSQQRSSLITWKLVPKTIQANEAFSSKFRLLCRSSVRAWFKTSLIIGPTRTMSSKSSSMPSHGL